MNIRTAGLTLIAVLALGGLGYTGQASAQHNNDRYDNRYDDARVTGYRVTFEYHGQTYTTTTDYHPGSNIRVRVNVEADGSNQVGYHDSDSRYSRY